MNKELPVKRERTLRALERARADARLRWQLAHVELRESVHAWVAACEALEHARAARKKERK